jgi:dynein heavy chain
MGLFEKDKIIYSFLICISIQRDRNTLDEQHFSYLIKGPGIVNRADQPKKPAEFANILSDEQWDLAHAL